jgi:D-alanine transaminase
MIQYSKEEITMPELAYLNGKFMPIEEAMVPIEDRGYQFGDAVYEVVNSYCGNLFGLEEHLDRLERSLRELSYPPVSREDIRNAMIEILKRSGMERAGVYLQISRGVVPRNHAYTDAVSVQIVMTVRPVKEVDSELRVNGATAITMTDIRWGRCDIKTVQLLPNCLAKQKAIEAGAYDTIFVTDEGIVRETTISNVFIVRDGKVVTHPANHNILNGITRMMVIDCVKELNLPFEEQFYTSSEMFAADEVFLSGTTIEVLSIVKVDDRTIANGKVGPITNRLYEALHAKTPK